MKGKNDICDHLYKILMLSAKSYWFGDKQRMEKVEWTILPLKTDILIASSHAFNLEIVKKK